MFVLIGVWVVLKVGKGWIVFICKFVELIFWFGKICERVGLCFFLYEVWLF